VSQWTNYDGRMIMDPNEFKNIIYDKDDQTGIVLVSINRPEIKNALSILVLIELHRAAENNDPTTEAFSSGGYFNPAELESLDEETRAAIDLTDIAQKKLCLKLWRINKPIIAAINGLAIGGGFTVPLACADLIYVSEHAWVKLPFISLGIIPELASSYLLPRILGFQRAKEILFFGERLDARKLLDLGLVNKILPHDELIAYSKEIAAKLVPPRGASLAVGLTKQALHGPLIEAVSRALDAENEGLNKTFASADFWEALAARKEKRAPNFKGI